MEKYVHLHIYRFDFHWIIRVPGVAPARRETVPLGLMLVVLMETGMPKRAVKDEF